MEKKRWLFGGPIIAACLMIGLSGLATRAQVTQPAMLLTAQETQDIAADVKAAMTPAVAAAAAAQPAPFLALVQDATLPFTYANVKEQVDAVTHEALRQHLDSAWESSPPTSVVILLEDPTGKAKVKMQIGVSLPSNSQVKPQGPLKVAQVPSLKAVRHIHQGPHSLLGDVYHTIDAQLKPSKLKAAFPVLLQFIDDPGRVSNQFVRTLIHVPSAPAQ